MNEPRPVASPGQRALGGLLVKKLRWTLSLRGRLLGLLLVLVAGLAAAMGLYPFLAITDRTSGELLVVEGWINSHSVGQTASEYIAAHQGREVVVVNAVYPEGDRWESGRYRSEYIVEGLIRQGVPKDRVHAVFCDVVRKDRTYESALAVKNWIQEQGLAVNAVDVVTLGPHARRSRLLFQKAFGQSVKVGVIALDEWSYDPARWWRYSDGVREVLFEGVAYLYARLSVWICAPGTCR
jgi:uncharacterized SAM-binding protein YcdF (DUF218 family)